MTSRERLLAAYAHKPVDRIPCSPRVPVWMREYYGDSGPATMLRMAEEFGFDPHVNVGEEEETALKAVIAGSRLMGPGGKVKVKEFEDAVAEFFGVRHVVMVTSGTTALNTGLASLGVAEGLSISTGMSPASNILLFLPDV